MQALLQRCTPWQAVCLRNACDFLEEGTCLEHETLVLADTYAWSIHSETCAPVWVVGTKGDRAVASFLGSIRGCRWGEDVELAWLAEVEEYRALLAEQLEAQGIWVALRDTGDLDGCGSTTCKVAGEGRHVIIFYRLELIRDRATFMANHGAQWLRTLR